MLRSISYSRQFFAVIAAGLFMGIFSAGKSQAQYVNPFYNSRPISAQTGVDVGPGHAGATAGASGAWQHTQTKTHVSGGSSLAQGLAIGAGPNGLALSHSIGGSAGGRSVGHNFNLAIGQGGTHVSSGSVRSSGGNPRIIAGGGVTQRRSFPGSTPRVYGGSTVGGFGNRTTTRTRAFTRLFNR